MINSGDRVCDQHTRFFFVKVGPFFKYNMMIIKGHVFSGVNKPLEYKSLESDINLDTELVDITYSALNHRDVWITKGQYPGINHGIILGSDASGIHDAKEVIINPGIGWGDNPQVQSDSYHILGMPTHGTFADKLSVSSTQIYLKPPHLTMLEAAALPLGGLTAYRALMTRARAQVSDKVLISGVGGGVALFALQFALALGCETYVTSSDDDKIDKAIKMGAVAGFNYKNDQWEKDLIKVSNGGVDVVIDSAGGQGMNQLIKATSPGGRIAFYGATRGDFTKLNAALLFWRQISLLGSTMGSDQDFVDMLRFVEKHKIRPVIDKVFPLSGLNEALDYMAKGLQFGKIVIDNKA